MIDDTSYPAAGVVGQIAMAAALGVGYYRVDFLVPTTDAGSTDWSWYDAVVAAGQSDAWLQGQVSMLVTRYAGQIPLYQLQNEMDGVCITSSGVDGSSTDHYKPEVYGPVRDRMAAIGAGVRASDSQAGLVVNITWKHTGFLQLLNDDHLDHLDYDVNGLDWYWGMDDMLAVLQVMDGFPQNQILLTELDIDGGTQSSTEAQQADYLTTAIHTLKASAPAKVQGVYVYELLDQPAWDASQAHYGLVNVNADGSWGPRKQAYGTYSHLIAGR